MRNVIAALLLLTAFPAAAQNNEKLFSTDLNVRTILSFKVIRRRCSKIIAGGV
jgi:hypothetical protein